MKKPYQKPQLYAERFALMEHIAGCGHPGIGTHDNATVCAFEVSDSTKLFYDSTLNGACTTPVPAIDDREQFPYVECYSSPFAGDGLTSTFAS